MPAPEVVAQRDDLVIRRMRDSVEDYERMVRWRNLPHVREFWDPDDPPMTMATAIEEYRPDTAPDAASTACIIEVSGKPVGFVQFYRWNSYAKEARDVGIEFGDDTWSLDIFIGEPDEVHRGLGTRVVDLLCEHLERERGATEVTLTTELHNATAIRCYEKAGFVRGRQVLEHDTRDGKPMKTWIMTRKAPGRP